MDNVEMIVNDLENLVYNAKKTVFNGNEVTINRSQLLQLIGEIKQSLPSEIRESRLIMQDANRIIADAQNRANAIINQAEESRKLALDESEIIREAQQQADMIINEAKEFKENVEYDVKLKIDQLLADTETSLNDALSLVHSNRESLRSHMTK